MHRTHIAFIAGLACVCMLALSSCKSVDIKPYDYGYVAGTAAYLGYTKVAEKQSEEFRAKVAEVWAKVDAIEDPSEIPPVLSELADLLEFEGLSEADRAALKAIARLILSKFSPELDEKSIEFLKGVRDGVDAARVL